MNFYNWTYPCNYYLDQEYYWQPRSLQVIIPTKITAILTSFTIDSFCFHWSLNIWKNILYLFFLGVSGFFCLLCLWDSPMFSVTVVSSEDNLKNGIKSFCLFCLVQISKCTNGIQWKSPKSPHPCFPVPQFHFLEANNSSCVSF